VCHMPSSYVFDVDLVDVVAGGGETTAGDVVGGVAVGVVGAITVVGVVTAVDVVDVVVLDVDSADVFCSDGVDDELDVDVVEVVDVVRGVVASIYTTLVVVFGWSSTLMTETVVGASARAVVVGDVATTVTVTAASPEPDPEPEPEPEPSIGTTAYLGAKPPEPGNCARGSFNGSALQAAISAVVADKRLAMRLKYIVKAVSSP